MNFNLPNEIILKIVSFLSTKDILSMSIAKLFLPTILSTPFIRINLKIMQNHVLIQKYIHCTDYFAKKVLSPLIIDNNFYLGIDTFKINDQNMLKPNKSYSLDIFFENLQEFSYIFKPFKEFTSTRCQCLSDSNCDEQCQCYLFHFKSFGDFIFFFNYYFHE